MKYVVNNSTTNYAFWWSKDLMILYGLDCNMHPFFYSTGENSESTKTTIKRTHPHSRIEGRGKREPKSTFLPKKGDTILKN